MKVKEYIRKNYLFLIFYAIIVTLLISKDAKSFLLKQIISTGFFNAKIDKKTQLESTNDFIYTGNFGEKKNLKELTGKVVFINIWASWCPPCRAEMPDLNEFYLKFKDDERIAFIFLNEDGDNSKGLEYLENKGFEIPFQKAVSVIPSEIFSGTLPTTVVLNKKGQIIMKHSGIAGYNNKSFIDQITSHF
ncbi:MAG: TlpA family protein disulfide reductase [Bacteroidetes bacterium]|nr:TlpA family protein disulfide reductase [Bacteroidota bacterium]